MTFSIFDSKPKEKKSLVKRFPVLFPFGVFLIIIFGYSLVGDTIQTTSIGVVELNGVILDSEPLIKKLRVLETNPSVAGIIVRINSPGGAVSPSQEIFNELLRIKELKKVYASISSTAASGGYYVAIGADKIFANPGSMVGSIGAVIQTFNFQGLMDKIGIKSEVIKSGENKDIGSVFRQMTEEERLLLEGVIKDTHDQFINAIADNRPIDLEEVKRIADGRVFTGRQAKNLGLVDQLAGFRGTISQLKEDLNIKEEIKLLYPPDEKEIIETILELESLSKIKEAIGLSTGLYYLGGHGFEL